MVQGAVARWAVQHWGEDDVFIDPVADSTDGAAHGEGGEDGADAESVEMTEKGNGQCCRCCQAEHVEADFDARVATACDGRQLTRKKISRDDRQSAAVGEGNA